MDKIKKIMSRSVSSKDEDQDEDPGFGLFDEDPPEGEYGEEYQGEDSEQELGTHHPSAPPPPPKENNYENTPKPEVTQDRDIVEIKNILTDLVNQVATTNTEVKSDLALLTQRVTTIEKQQKKKRKKHRRSIKATYDSSEDDTTDSDENQETTEKQPVTVANVNKSVNEKVYSEPQTNPYYKRGAEWKAAYDAMCDTKFKGPLKFQNYEALLQRSGIYKNIPAAAEVDDVLAHLQVIREKFCSLRINPDPKTYANVVLDKIPATLRKNLSLARSRGLIATEEDLCSTLKQLIVGGSSFPAEKIRARQQLLEKFPQQDRNLLDPNEVALYCMGDLSEKVLVTKQNYAQLKEGEKDLLRQTLAKELFTYYIQQRCDDANEWIQRNMYGEEDLLQISGRISAYLKHPLTLPQANLGSLVGNVETPDPASVAEQFKRTQEKMDQKLPN